MSGFIYDSCCSCEQCKKIREDHHSQPSVIKMYAEMKQRIQIEEDARLCANQWHEDFCNEE